MQEHLAFNNDQNHLSLAHHTMHHAARKMKYCNIRKYTVIYCSGFKPEKLASSMATTCANG
jgi:hypothetical protein